MLDSGFAVATFAQNDNNLAFSRIWGSSRDALGGDEVVTSGGKARTNYFSPVGNSG